MSDKIPKPAVYVITNIINGKRYVGGTKNYVHRQRQHFSNLKLNKHGNKSLQDDFNKFGRVCFSFLVLQHLPENSTEAEIISVEQKWLDELHPEYNVNHIAGKYIGDYMYTSEVREKRRLAGLGKKQSPEHIKKRADAIRRGGKQKLKRLTEEQKAHLSAINMGEKNPNWGLKREQSTKDMIANAVAKTWSGLISPDGTVYSPIKNLMLFCREHNLEYFSMVDVAKGKRAQYNGWRRYSQIIHARLYLNSTI